jgi:outer membrane receptor protein involved in Fe transport
MTQGGLAQTKASVADTPALDTVIVSARKRDEPLATVPESITVFTPGTLTALNIQSFNDYATKTPNVSFTNGPGSTGVSNARTVAIRGITGQNLFGTAGATGFYIDDTPVPESVDPRVLDIDRVEILKGPQGTLFGESSLGGNIRLITKRPDLTRNNVGYLAQVGLTSGGGSADGGASVIGNIVVVPDSLAIRVVLFGNHDAGYLTRTFPERASPAVGDPFLAAPRTSVKDQGAQTMFGGSATVLWRPNDAIEARLRIMFQDTHDKGFPATFAALPAFRPVYTLDRAFDIQPSATDNWVLPSLDISYRADGFRVLSSTSYFYRHNRDIEDSTYGTQQILRGYYGVEALPNQPFLWDQEHYHNQFTEELRLTFDEFHGIRGTVGSFYARTRSTLAIPPTYAQGLHAATISNTVVGPWPNDLLWTDHNPATQEDISLFGEITWAFTKSFSATLGARQYWLSQTTDFTADGFNNFGPTSSDPQRSHQSGFNPKIGVSYQASDSTLVYASASEGFRAGAAQPYLPFCALPTLPIDNITHLKSDSLWSYELGTKVQVPRTGLLLSAAAFHIDWRNLQQQLALPCGAYFDINGGLARINGAEVELDGHITPSFELRLGAGYEKTDITRPGALAIVGVLPGSRILGTPAWTASFAGIFTRPVSAHLDGFIEADYSFTGDSVSLLNGGNGTFAIRPSYGLVGLRLGVRRDNSELSLNLRNLTNAKPNLGDVGYVGYAQYNSAGTIIPQVATLEPLTVVLQYRHNL